MKKISDETKTAILEAAWRLMAEKGRVDVGQGEIATAAGVSRQSIFYAFGNRTGLLTAMVRHKDATSPRHARLLGVAQQRRSDPEQLLDIVEAWIDYIPDIYPVASLLDVAGIADAEARAAIDDRLVGQLLTGLTLQLRAMRKRGQLEPGTEPDRAAQAIWEASHIRAWRSLVIECGWSPDEFKRSRMDIARSFVVKRPTSARD
jgi:AcrR family transcriptional regulator